MYSRQTRFRPSLDRALESHGYSQNGKNERDERRVYVERGSVYSSHTRYNKFQKDEARVGPSPDFEWRRLAWFSKRSIDVEPIIFPI